MVFISSSIRRLEIEFCVKKNFVKIARKFCMTGFKNFQIQVSLLRVNIALPSKPLAIYIQQWKN